MCPTIDIGGRHPVARHEPDRMHADRRSHRLAIDPHSMKLLRKNLSGVW